MTYSIESHIWLRNYIDVFPQPPKDFRKSFYPNKDFKKLLDLPVDQRKAPLLLNYIQLGSTSAPAEQPSTSAPQLIPPFQRQRQRRALIFAPASWTCSRRRRSTEASSYDPANPPTALLTIYLGTKVTIAISTDEMGRQKAVADDLLADIPNVVTVQSFPSQSQPKLKPKRLKKAQTKATVTQIDSKDTLLISKMAEVEKSASAAEKRPAEAAPSESTRSKKLRSKSATTSGSLKFDVPWAPPITIEDKPVRVDDSATDIEVGVALSTALLLSKDLERNAEAFDIKKELTHKTKEAAGLLKTINKAEAKMKTLINQAKAAKQAPDEADERARAAEAVAEVLKVEKKDAEAKMIEAQAELRDAMATKTAEIKVSDEKAYAEGAVDVREDYKKQDVEGEVSKGASPQKTISEVPIAEKSIDQTLREIDAKVEAEKAAEKIP
ncbi:uncharacterized protein LOC114260781 [Camellia sinensis]|uniref:uncharacterized protein LOC114260781 n=1 Tax=Camellia sinensis TaxID=4442 RepID=UPI0010369D5D|nr:uncharacterized protein LOC114260781 [Camellia sinensis]